MWNAVAYFEDRQKKLKLTKNYLFCRISGLNHLEGIVTAHQGHKDFFAVNDVDDGGVIIRIGAGYFIRRKIIVFILKKYDLKNQLDRETKLGETRIIRDKLQARLIKDSNDIPELYYLDKTKFPYKEVPGFFANGTCGFYFFVTIDEPTSLIHNPDDWE